MNKTIEKIVTRIANAAGYQIIPQWKMLELEHALFLRKLFSHYQIQTIFDVGANNGGYHDFLRQQVGYSGEIFSFEPVSTNVEQLHQKAKKDPKWHIFDYALGSKAEQKTINVMKSHDFSSFQNPTHDVIDDYKKYNVVERKEIVNIKTLDSVFPELQQNYNLDKFYLKMDTQGFDYEVFKGATQILSQVVAFQSEVSVQQIYEGSVNYQQTINNYSDAGFELSGLFPVNRDKYLRVVEFDCLMINSLHLKSIKKTTKH